MTAPVAPYSFGHDLKYDPPSLVPRVLRWTCAVPGCGARLMMFRGNLYGNATEDPCRPEEQT